MNDSRVNKVIKFEGAGWSKADTSQATDMANCRVRTTFINDKGQKIYFELSCYDNRSGRSASKWHRGFSMPWHINFLFFTAEHKQSRSNHFRQASEQVQEFTKASVLRFLQQECSASFEQLETINWEGERDDQAWDGFSHTGLAADDFHNEGAH